MNAISLKLGCNESKAEMKEEKVADKPKTNAVAKVAIAKLSNSPVCSRWAHSTKGDAIQVDHWTNELTLRKVYHILKAKWPQKVWLGNDHYILAIREGHIALTMDLSGHQLPAIVQKVLHIPEIQGNLLSVSSLIHNSLQVTFDTNNCYIYNKSG